MTLPSLFGEREDHAGTEASAAIVGSWNNDIVKFWELRALLVLHEPGQEAHVEKLQYPVEKSTPASR